MKTIFRNKAQSKKYLESQAHAPYRGNHFKLQQRIQP